MTTLRECADTAAAALVEMLRASRGKVDTAAVADVIETVLNQATSERAREQISPQLAKVRQGRGRLSRPSSASGKGTTRGPEETGHGVQAQADRLRP